jgi:hypothetical protein
MPRPEPPDYTRLKPKQFSQASAGYSDAMREYEASYHPWQTFLDDEATLFGEDRACDIKDGVSIAGAGGNATYWMKADKLDLIVGGFRRESYPTVKAAIVAKYGAPSETAVHDYRNEAGAQYQGEVALWKRPDSVIELDEVQTGEVGASGLTIANPATRQAYEAAKQQQANASF